MLSQESQYSRSNYQDVIDNTIKRWPQDEISILDGNCSPRVYYLGSVEVSEPTSSKTCRESSAKLYQGYKKGIYQLNPAVLWITGYELRIVEEKSKNLILAQTIENVIFCASITDNPDQFFFTCKDTYNDRFSCHLFIVKDFSGVRLCKAVGFAFRVCLRRKIIREGLSINTMINTRSIG